MHFFSTTPQNFKDWRRELFKMKFIRDTVILQWGSFWDLGLSFVASIIYARLLGVGTYGDYALIFAFASLVNLFINWGTGYAILTLLATAYAKNDRQEIKDIVTYYFKISLVIFGTIGAVAVIWAPFLSQLLYHNPVIGQLARLIIISYFCQIFFSLLTSLLQVMRKIKYLTIAENVNKFFSVALPVTLVLLGFGLPGIAWGYLVSIVGSMVFAVQVYRHFARRNELVPHFRDVLKNFGRVKLSRYLGYGFVMAADNNIANSFGLWPVMILGYLASPSDVANLKIALAYLALPNVFLGPIARLLLVQLPKAKVAGSEHLKANFYKTSAVSGLSYIIIAGIFLVIAPFLIRLFYGREFSSSINMVYPLGLSVIFSGFTIGIGSLYRTINKNIYGIAINLFVMASGFFAFLIWSHWLEPVPAVIALVIYWAWFAALGHFIYLRNYLKKLS